MRILNSLYAKISIIFLLLLLALGTVQLLVALNASMGFVQETDQKLNRNLATQLAERFRPFLDQGPDYGAIEHTFHELMVMNPRVEIYLLDESGSLLAYFADPEQIKRMAVDIRAIRTFLEDDGASFPLLGDDPRSDHRQKPFSAARVTIGGVQSGYLYVILGGEQYDSASSMVENSTIFRTTGILLAGSFISTGLIGLLLFSLLTKRLATVTEAVRRFEDGDYAERVPVPTDDEIGRLARAFNQMADRIVGHIEEIKQTDRLRRELVANVSHDLRSPLASIQGYLETVLMKGEGLARERRNRFLETVYRSVTGLSRLVNELFDLSKLDAQQARPDLEAFPPAELIQDLVLELQPRAMEKDITLETDYARDLPPAFADIGMIQRVLTNLVENALRYTPAGGKVTVGAREVGGFVEATVNDTGPGIPPEDLPYVFERFYRGEKSRSRHSGGSGLGLSIARKIMEAHGETLDVESRPEGGSRFLFRLPTLPRDVSPTAATQAAYDRA